MTISDQFGGDRTPSTSSIDRRDHLDALMEVIPHAYADIESFPDLMKNHGISSEYIQTIENILDTSIKANAPLESQTLGQLIQFAEKMGRCYSALSLNCEGQEDQGYQPIYATFTASLSNQLNYLLGERAKVTPITIATQPTNDYR